MSMPVSLTFTRGYEREFDWAYEEPAPRPPLRELVPVIWDGLYLNTGDQEGGLCAVVTGIEGWLDSPPLDGNDVARVISDGASWGPKVMRARVITVNGAAAGPRDQLGAFRDQLSRRAASREPAMLAVGDWDLRRVLTADVRAGTDSYRHRPLGSGGFRWQVTLTAADPALYSGLWSNAQLTNLPEDEGTGRLYAREFTWAYRVGYLPNTTVLENAGNLPAPVYALYEGPLIDSLLTDPAGGMVLLRGLVQNEAIIVNLSALTAEAPGGYSRASYILPGSRPMFVPPQSSARWYLRAAGAGSVTLAWRHTWS